jgi:hypothetical protein
MKPLPTPLLYPSHLSAFLRADVLGTLCMMKPQSGETRRTSPIEIRGKSQQTFSFRMNTITFHEVKTKTVE